MTWYANEVIALATPEVLQAVRSNAQLTLFAYHLTNPLEFDWPTPEAAHDFPKEGLLVIRPMCDPTTEERVAESFGEPYLDWREIPERPDFLPLLDRELVAQELAIAVEELPPPAFLSCIKELAATTGSVFLFYSCFMFIGDVEWEYAWLFQQRERVICCVRPKIPEANEVVSIMEPDEEIHLRTDEDTLRMALISVQTFIKTSFFAPHTRTFLWTKYKLSAAGGPTG